MPLSCPIQGGKASQECDRERVVSHKPGVSAAGQGADEALHFEPHEVWGHGGRVQAGAGGDLVDVGFVGTDGVVEDSLVEREAGLGGGFLDLGCLRGGGEEGHEVIEDVIAIHDKFGPLLNEAIAARRCGLVDRARNGKNGSPLLDGLLGGDEGATSCGRLDDEESATPSGDDSISIGKGLFVGESVNGILADDGSAGDDAFGEREVFRRVELTDPGADDGDGASFGCKGGLVGDGIDPPCESADDRVTGVGDLEA